MSVRPPSWGRMSHEEQNVAIFLVVVGGGMVLWCAAWYLVAVLGGPRW